MAEDSIIAYCRVYDGFQSLDVQMEQCITPEMLQHCRFAHSRYVNHMEDNKKTKCKKWKIQREAIQEELNQAQKEQKLDTTHTDLRKEADQLAIDAEKKNVMDLLAKLNALRSKAKDKMVELQTEADKIKDLKDKLYEL